MNSTKSQEGRATRLKFLFLVFIVLGGGLGVTASVVLDLSFVEGTLLAGGGTFLGGMAALGIAMVKAAGRVS